MDDSLERLRGQIRSLRRSRQAGREKPHKPVMLLALLDLLDRGAVTTNQFYFDTLLIDRFSILFAAVAKIGDWRQAAPPFFHLRTSGFWAHQPKQGREKAYADLRSSGGGYRRIRDNIEFAFFEEWAWNVVVDPANRTVLRELVLDHFFSSEERYRLMLVIDQSTRSAQDM